MRVFSLFVASTALALAAGAAAADVTIGGKPVAPGEVTGPATIKVTREKGEDTLDLRKGAVLRYLGPEKDQKGTKVAESFFLKSGGVDADLGFTTRLATPAFWAFPEKAGSRVTFYAETFNTTTAYARTKEKSGLLRLVVIPNDRGSLEVDLGGNQGVTLQSPRDAKGVQQNELMFVTDPHNEWKVSGSVRVLYPVLSTGLLIDLYVPKATTGFVRPKPEDPQGKTLIGNMISSWKSASIRVVTARGGTFLFEDSLGPGVTAEVDNRSGKIEIGFAQVELTTLKAAISLTSEFASLATSPLSSP